MKTVSEVIIDYLIDQGIEYIIGIPGHGCLPFFDAICIGPAERIWQKIIRDAGAGCLQKKYCDMENFCGNEIAPPAFGFLKKKNYLYTNVVLSGRGCPNRCSFCYNSCKNRMFANRPVPDVIREIKTLGTRHILFIDDNFTGYP